MILVSYLLQMRSIILHGPAYNGNDHFQFSVLLRINYNHWFRWDYSGQFLYSAFNYNAHATFKNNWQAGTGTTWNNYEVSNNALRGGPSLRRPAGIGPWGYVSTDFRKKVAFNLNLNYFWGFENTVKGGDYSLGITLSTN